MKKVLVVIICMCLLVGCNSTKEEANQNNSNSNQEIISNSNNTENFNDEEISNSASNTVHLYLFHLSTCEHCQSEIAWLKSIKDDYPYLQIHYYEVTESASLYKKVREALNIDTTSVPLTFIGNDYYVGFSDAKGRKFERIIKEESEKDKCDVIGTIIDDGDVETCVKYNEKGE